MDLRSQSMQTTRDSILATEFWPPTKSQKLTLARVSFFNFQKSVFSTFRPQNSIHASRNPHQIEENEKFSRSWDFQITAPSPAWAMIPTLLENFRKYLPLLEYIFWLRPWNVFYGHRTSTNVFFQTSSKKMRLEMLINFYAVWSSISFTSPSYDQNCTPFLLFIFSFLFIILCVYVYINIIIITIIFVFVF